MKVLKSNPVSISEVLQIIKKRAEEGELGYEQQSTLEYSENFAKLNSKEEKKIIDEIMSNEKINEETAIKIVDLSPKNIDLVKSILLKENITLDDAELSKIVKLFSK